MTEADRIDYRSSKEKFDERIADRYELWLGITRDSMVNEETKTRIIESLSIFKDSTFAYWKNLDDAVHDTISRLLAITKQDSNKEQAESLFDNLRDDLWAFWKEMQT